jgi:multimeric flavodoxin WrbA
MYILGLVGSPRKASNTDLLVERVLDGAASNGHTAQKVFLYEFKIEPCVDCKACKKGANQCKLQDDMPKLYPELEKADVIVFGTPLYWYGPSAKMKLSIDRLRPYIASKKLQNKKALLVIPSEEGADACELTVGMFSSSLKYLQMDLVGVLLPTASERAEAKKQPQTLSQAFTLGQDLK